MIRAVAMAWRAGTASRRFARAQGHPAGSSDVPLLPVGALPSLPHSSPASPFRRDGPAGLVAGARAPVDMRGLMASVLAFTVFFAARAVLYRAVSRRGHPAKIVVMLWLWAAGGLVYVALFRLLPDDSTYLPGILAVPGGTLTLISGAFICWRPFAAYYQLFNMADNSMGVRCLIELSRVPEQGSRWRSSSLSPVRSVLGGLMIHVVFLCAHACR